MRMAIITAALLFSLSGTALSRDRFGPIVEAAPEPSLNANGDLVNHQRVAVQAEITKRPPTAAELGVAVPKGSKLNIKRTALQIAQYHPVWRIYDFEISMPRSALIQHFESQGLTFDKSANVLRFPGSEDFVDGLFGQNVSGFRIWRKP